MLYNEIPIWVQFNLLKYLKPTDIFSEKLFFDQKSKTNIQNISIPLSLWTLQRKFQFKLTHKKACSQENICS